MFRSAALLFWFALPACGGTSASSPDAGPVAACDPSQYPCGPFGFGLGGRIANLTFTGRRDTDGNGSVLDDPIAPIQLSDYFTNKKYQVLAISLAAEWCLPCRTEQPYLISTFQGYQANGGKVAYLEVLEQKSDGSVASSTNVDAWTSAYDTPFDMAADPTMALASYYNVNSFPDQLVIRTADMSIRWINPGPAEPGLKNTIDQILASP